MPRDYEALVSNQICRGDERTLDVQIRFLTARGWQHTRKATITSWMGMRSPKRGLGRSRESAQATICASASAISTTSARSMFASSTSIALIRVWAIRRFPLQERDRPKNSMPLHRQRLAGSAVSASSVDYFAIIIPSQLDSPRIRAVNARPRRRTISGRARCCGAGSADHSLTRR
jgi:hypothetical protein